MMDKRFSYESAADAKTIGTVVQALLLCDMTTITLVKEPYDYAGVFIHILAINEEDE